MKRFPFFFFLATLLLLASCESSLSPTLGKDAFDSITIMRYDRVEARYLTTGDFSALQEMNTTYPTQTRALIEDLLRLGTVSDKDINKHLLEYFQDSTLQNIIFAAESEYADMSDLTKELKTAFRNMKRELPNTDIPLFYAQIGALDQSIVVDNNVIGISLDKYLGEDFAIYGRYYDEGQRKTMNREFIVPDVITFYLLSSYGVNEFRENSQHWRDTYMGIVMYATNKFVGRDAMKSVYIDKVSKYMKKHPELSLKDLLEMTDYSEI